MKIFFLCITEHAELGHVKQIKKMKKVCPDPPPCWENSQFFFSNEPFPNKKSIKKSLIKSKKILYKVYKSW